MLLPAALPEVFTGLRIGFTVTLLGVLLGEMFASKHGLGSMIMTDMSLAQSEDMVTVAIILFAFAALANGILLWIEHRLHRRVSQVLALAHVLVGKPAATFPGHALIRERAGMVLQFARRCRHRRCSEVGAMGQDDEARLAVIERPCRRPRSYKASCQHRRPECPAPAA